MAASIVLTDEFNQLNLNDKLSELSSVVFVILDEQGMDNYEVTFARSWSKGSTFKLETADGLY